MVQMTLVALFALLAAVDVWQLVQAARGVHPDPAGLLVTHAVTGALAGLTAAGLWRGRRWTLAALLGWGTVTAGMIVALGPVLDTPPEEYPQLWLVAALVAAFTLAVFLYLRRRVRA